MYIICNNQYVINVYNHHETKGPRAINCLFACPCWVCFEVMPWLCPVPAAEFVAAGAVLNCASLKHRAEGGAP